MAFSQEIADKVCERLAAGESLRKACKAVDGAKVQTILDWTVAETVFAGQYAQARAQGYALLADELVEIADESQNDTFIDDDGDVRTNAEVVARSRLRVDTRKWMLSKMLPKVYGDKLELGGNADSPLVINIQKLSQPEQIADELIDSVPKITA